MIEWKKSNFLKSKLEGFIAVNIPCKKGEEEIPYFEGVIINCEDQITKKMLHHNVKFAKENFELIEEKNVSVKYKGNEEVEEN